ncbi:MAG TPA: hypoxanthine phosphoribosyltransferase [Candidatus Dojkabacteria bacterium]|nr:hypoxanthine phosphoribosyltransferase [Candidatus Dojkabacteria bacterium]HOR05854.1 hypoxanthine phosphoribosyltransferase [Candidatus Dojkabacteria bacterium]HOT60783.1 hypoxanthine phosphoribosyltransferase [Candidatus Dojkabacteria bacterium]HQI92556.1 hypoxanthine phosphoribosyltransferase [Candidatus Dojkabacteria bacterium]
MTDPRETVEKREVLITSEQIKERVTELAAEIKDDVDVDNLVLVGVLNGASFFTTDLAREFNNPKVEIDFMSVSSYGNNIESSGEPVIHCDLKNSIMGKDVVIVEDIVDTGYSMAILLDILRARRPKSLRVCALLSKPDRREVDVPIDYVGFTIPNHWVEGYGLDTNEKCRCLKNITRRV